MSAHSHSNPTTRYDLGFTGSTLRLDRLLIVARAMHAGYDRDLTEELGNGNMATGKRMLIEFKKRLGTLTPDQLSMLVHGDLRSQKQLALLAVCKAYPFIRDFILEVVREKALVFDMQLTDGEYLTFARRKAELHPELDEVTPITLNKMRQVVMKVLEESGLIDSVRKKVIQQQVLVPDLVRCISADSPDWLKLYLLKERDIHPTAVTR